MTRKDAAWRAAGTAERARDWSGAFVGLDEEVSLADGRRVRYVNLDHAATTPPLRAVVDAVHESLRWYGSVHRGSGYKARRSTADYDEAHATIARFVGADLARNVVIFGKNTTEAINKLSRRLAMPDGSVVVTTQLEHHSNDLPWRRCATVVHARATPDGRLDEDDLDRLLRQYAGRVALVAVTGASNVTGVVPPIHRLARKAHAAGARILVDAAQLVAHRRLDMRPDDDPEHLDFVAFSGHKMYAPFGTGVLVGPRDTFLDGAPDVVGGGTVDVVTTHDVTWAGLPDREEAGTPNAMGAVAIAAAARVLMDWGLDAVRAHEDALAAYARERLRAVPGLTLYGEPPAGWTSDRVGVVPFNLAHLHHEQLAGLLGEAGIGVRNGCFCAQPYVAHLLRASASHWDAGAAGAGGWPAGGAGLAGAVSATEVSTTEVPATAVPASEVRPGMVRLSLGAGNTRADVDALVALVEEAAGRARRRAPGTATRRVLRWGGSAARVAPGPRDVVSRV
ncbi:MAG: aminotransferase class V-fold PLP-dependent enzyme [Vicinamibacterales bacterium]